MAAAGARQGGAYTYLRLADAAQLEPGASQCHLYGVVTECTEPRPTRGTDWVVNMTIVDNSTPTRTDGLKSGLELTVFATDKDTLPRLREIGDIVRLHRVKVDRFMNRAQFVLKLGRPSSFVLFSRESAAGTPQHNVPYQKSSEQYSFDNHDAMHLANLRGLGAAVAAAPAASAQGAAYLKSICALAPGPGGSGFFDLLCQVLYVDWPAEGVTSAPVMYVWDGTDAKPMHVDTCFVPEGLPALEERALPLRKAVEALPWPAGGGTASPLALPAGDGASGSAAPPAALLSALWRSSSFLGGVPPVGTALPVALTPESSMLQRNGRASLPPPGTWVKLRNIGAAAVHGQLQGVYTAQSKWAATSAAADLVADAAARAGRGVLAHWAPRSAAAAAECATRLAPHLAAAAVPFASLREALACPAPSKFRCLVRVTGHLPREAHLFTSPRAAADAAAAALATARGEPPPPPPPPGASDHVYSLLLRLEDATSAIDALLFDQDGDTFFHGIPACRMEPGSGVAAALAAKMSRLLNWQRDGGEWLQVCIASHLDATAVAPGASPSPAAQMAPDVKRFRIFGTALVQ